MRAGRLAWEDLRATPETLRAQAARRGRRRTACARREPRARSRAVDLAGRADSRDLHGAPAAPLDGRGARGVGGTARRRRCHLPPRPSCARRRTSMRSEGCLPEPDARSKRFEAREQRGLRKELLVAPAAGARPRRDGRAERPGAEPRRRGRPRRRDRRARRGGRSTSSTGSSRAGGSTSRRPRRRRSSTTRRSPAGSSTSTARATSSST